MSMIGNLLRVSKEELDSFLADSSLLEKAIYDEETDEENPNLTDIDKSWNGILYLLTGKNIDDTDHPMAKVIFSGQIIDEEQDLGYGPAHYLIPEQVKELSTQLSAITEDELKQRYNPTEMDQLEIYPTGGGWDDDMFNYLRDYFKDVREVYATAAKNNEALITFIN